MKIGPSFDIPVPAELTARNGAPAAAAATSRVGTATDRVDVSAAGVQMGAAGNNDFDAAKVDAIRRAIREGRFSVNAGAIADRLIADASALLRPRGA